MFSPSLGRFVQPDPTGFAAGDTDLYRAEENNPLNRVDPSGLQPDPSLPPLQIRPDHVVTGYDFVGTNISAEDYFDEINKYLEKMAAANRPLRLGELLTLLRILNIRLEQGVGPAMDGAVRQAFRRMARNAGNLLCRSDVTAALAAYIATVPDKKKAEEIRELIKKLGDRKFSIREKASRDLLEMLTNRPGTEKVIGEGLNDPSAEVRLRIKRILEAGLTSGGSIIPLK